MQIAFWLGVEASVVPRPAPGAGILSGWNPWRHRACCPSLCELISASVPLCLEDTLLRVVHPLWTTLPTSSSTEIADP